MSPTEALSSVATTAIDSMKSTPVVLGVLLLNLLFMGAMVWSLGTVRKIEKAQLHYVLERCLPRSGS